MSSIETISAIIGIGGSVGSTAYVVIKRYIDRELVRRVKVSTDPDVDPFLDLCERVFSDNVRIPSEESVRWFDDQRRSLPNTPNRLEHYLYVSKAKGQLLGFIRCLFDPASRYMFVGYYGIDRSITAARSSAAKALIKSLLKLVTREIQGCKALIFEAEEPNTTSNAENNRERRARIKLFAETARRSRFPLYKIDIPYLQPKITFNPDDDAAEESMGLFYIPIARQPPGRFLPHNEVDEILDVLYILIYGAEFRHQLDVHERYLDYLQDLLLRVKAGVPRGQVRIVER